MNSAAETDRIAAEWVVREDRRELTPAERAELDAWLQSDPRRQGAYVRAHAAWSMLDRGRALAEQGGPPQPRRWPVVTRRELIAASAVGVAGLGAALAVTRMGEERYRTDRGEIRRVPLRDGSVAAINTASRLEVAMEDDRRVARLARGEAWFDVARDGARPFYVLAGDVRVRASGGAFSVRRLASGAEVIVTQGSVDCWASGGKPVRLAAGFKAVVGGEGGRAALVTAPASVDRLLAWREGMVGLDGETLAEAAAEFNRYNERQIVIDDAALANERLVGYFRANDPESFVRAAADTLGAELRIGEAELRLSPAARS